MPEFNSEEWEAVTGEKVVEVTPRHMVDIWVSCAKPVQVLGVPGTPGVSAVVLRTGQEFRFRGPVKNFKRIVIRGTGQTPFGLKVLHSARQNGEPLSDEKPPVIDLGEPSNLVAKMRRLAAEHHRYNRMPVLEPEDGPSFNRYEYDDDDELMFEEEAYEKRLEDRKKKAEKDKAEREAEAKARKEAEAEASHEPSPAPPAAKVKSGKEDPPPAKAAE